MCTLAAIRHPPQNFQPRLNDKKSLVVPQLCISIFAAWCCLFVGHISEGSGPEQTAIYNSPIRNKPYFGWFSQHQLSSKDMHQDMGNHQPKSRCVSKPPSSFNHIWRSLWRHMSPWDVKCRYGYRLNQNFWDFAVFQPKPILYVKGRWV